MLSTINPGVIWAYLLSTICKDDHFTRDSIEKQGGIPLPKFLPKGTGILETLLLLGVLNLPLRSGNMQIASNNKLGIVLKAPHDSLIYRDFFKKSEFNITNTTIVKSSIYSSMRSDKKYLTEGEPLWTDAVYQCDIAVTNLTAVEQTYTFLFQIPQGSISITDNKTMKYTSFTLGAFQTKNVGSGSFYFPYEGVYEHAPVFVYMENEVVAVSEKRKYNVKYEGSVKVASKDKQKTYQRKDKIGMAKRKELLDMLRTDPILGSDSEFRFEYIRHVLKDPAFYNEAIKILKKRKIFDQTTYSFSVIHYDYDTIPMYFDHIRARLDLGYWFPGSLVKAEPKDKNFRYLDYYPLINQRVHKLGKSKKILNDKFKTQYTEFLKIVASKYKMDNSDAMWFIYYLLLQDKIEQALEFYLKYKSQIIGDNRVQFDYLRCYMDFYLGEPNYQTAFEISERYKEYPVIGWRKLFESVNYKVKKALNIGAELKAQENIHEKSEIDLTDIVMDEQNKMLREQKFEHNITVKGEKSLDVVVKDQEIKITCTKLEKLDIFYYPVDYEILISNDPFSQMAFEKCTFIRTNNKSTVDVKGKTSLSIPIPKEYLQQTVFIQVKGDDYLQKEAIFYESNVLVYVNKEEKLIQILDNKERPLPFCYVKIFYKQGSGFFFRDGFTDFRGLFRYLGKHENSGTYPSIKVFAYHEEFGIKVLDI